MISLDRVAQGTQVGGANLGSVHEMQGDKTGSSTLAEGSLAVAVKSDHLKTATVYAAKSESVPETMLDLIRPMMSRIVYPLSDKDDAKLAMALEKLADDDPGLTVAREAVSGRLLVVTQGPLHFRTVRKHLKDVFGVVFNDDPPQTSYRETITQRVEKHYRHRKQSGGSGQFPDVKLIIEPNARNAGFAFDDSIKGGAVPSNYIPAVEAGARDALAAGPLGFEVIDVKVLLVDGQHHSVDSSDFAFRAAGRMAVREALVNAGPVLLQPIHRIEIHVPSRYSGALVPAISSLHGQVLGFDRDPAAKGWDTFQALLPAAALDGLLNTLRSATQGLGTYTSTFDHYEEIYGREAERIQETHRASKAAG